MWEKLWNVGGRIGSKVRRVGRGCCCCYSIVGLLFRTAMGRGYRETMREPRAMSRKGSCSWKKKTDQLERMRNGHGNTAESETCRQRKNKGKIKQKDKIT